MKKIAVCAWMQIAVFYTNTVFNCLIAWYVVFVKVVFVIFVLSMVIKKICKMKTNLSEIRKALPPPPSATVYVLQYSSFWNHKTKSYEIKTTGGIKKPEQIWNRSTAL